MQNPAPRAEPVSHRHTFIMIVDWLFNLNAWCVALISLTTYYILAVVAHWRKFRHLPNAGFNPFTAFIETFRNFDRFNDMLLEHTLKFGQKTWAMSPPGSTSMAYIMVTDPQCVEHILKTNFDNYIKGPEFTSRFHDILGHGIFNSDGTSWKQKRQSAAVLFTRNTMTDFMMQVFNEHSQQIVANLLRQQHNQKPIDMQEMFFRFTMDATGCIVFGKSLDCLRKDRVEFAEAFDRAQFIVNQRFLLPFWRFYYCCPWERELRRCMRTMDEFADSVIADRRSESVDELRNRSDLLSKIMSTEDASGNVVNPSDSELRDFVLNFMIAGRDTTANLLTWMLYELICHPDAIRRIREECDEVLSDHSPIEFDHVHSKLKYLDAVVLESLRLHTPVPKDPKLAVSSDRLPDGTFVPAGAHVMYAPWIMGRLPSVWGDDALEWRPERFLNQPQPNPYKFPVFQAGPRICLGRNMALLEAKTCICVLLKNLDFELAPDFKIKYRTTVTLPSDTGLWLVATPRKCV